MLAGATSFHVFDGQEPHQFQFDLPLIVLDAEDVIGWNNASPHIATP